MTILARLTTLVLVVTALAGAAPARRPADLSQGRRREIQIDATDKTKTYEIRSGVNVPTTITLPEGWLRVICGKCQLADQKYEGQLWRLDLFPETHELSISLATRPTSMPKPLEYASSIDVMLEGGVAIVLDLYLEVDDPTVVDLHVDLTLPEKYTLKAKLTKRERELEESFDERLGAEADKRVDELVMAGNVKCRDFAGRPNRNDKLIVRLRQMCRMGAMLFVSFDVENRLREDVHLLSATLTAQDKGESSGFHFEQPVVPWKKRVAGVVRFELPDRRAPSSTYTLSVAEDGRDERVVVVDNIEF